MVNTAFRAITVGIILSAAVGNSPGAQLTATELIREIQRDGPRAVLRRHFDTSVWATAILPGIKAASDGWLTVAELLHTSADAGGAEDIDLALYSALPVRPFPVLRVLEKKHKRSPSYLCNVSFEAEVPKGGALPYLLLIENALASASTREDKAIAAACRLGLAQARATATRNGLSERPGG